MRILITAALLLSFNNTFAQSINNELKITPLTGDFYIYNTYKLIGTTKQEANGMYLVTDKGVVLFDSPWDTCPFQPLLDSIEARHHKKVIMCIATHSHEDRTSGLDYYRQKGIKTYTSKQTDQISKEKESAQTRPRLARSGTGKVICPQHTYVEEWPTDLRSRHNRIRRVVLFGAAIGFQSNGRSALQDQS